MWIVVFWRLGYLSLLDPDEAHYAELTREMLRARSWLVPLLNDAPYIDKPVLFHWLQALSVSVFGQSELAMRLPSAFAALALIATTRWAGAQLFGAAVGEGAALMFATLPLTFALANVGVFDMVYGAFLFGGVSCLLVSALRGREHLQYLGYALLTVAVMTKGPVALLLVILFIMAAMCAGPRIRKVIGSLHWTGGLAFVLIAASPWFVWMWATFGDRFVSEYWLAGNLWYFTQPVVFSPRRSSYALYLRVFVTAFFPWCLVIIGAAFDAARRWRDGTQAAPERVLLWLWILVVVIFFTVARFKVDYYIFPAAPACCMLAADAWKRAVEDRSWRWTRASVAVIAATLIAGGLISSVALFQINLGLDYDALALPVALAVGGGLLMWELARRQWMPPPTLTTPLVTLLVVYSLTVVIGFPVLERSRPTAPVGRWIARHTRRGAVVGAYHLEDWRASIRYYADRRVTRLQEQDEVRAFLESSQTAYVLMLREDFAALRESGLEIEEVLRRPAIVGRSGKYLRRQVWGDLMIVTRNDNPEAWASTLFDTER